VVSQVTRPATQQATGLNVFFPSRPKDAAGYVSEHIGPPGWSRFVEAYAEAAAQAGSDQTASFVSNEATVLEQGRRGIRIAGQLSDGDWSNVTDTETQVYTRIDGRDALAVALPAYLNSGGVGTVQGVWDYAVTSLSDDTDSVPASAIYQAQAGGLIGSFWARYRSPAGEVSDVVFRVLLDSQGEIQSITVSDASGQATAGVDLEVGGELTPYLIVPSSTSFDMVALSRSIPVTRRLRVEYPQLPAGTRFEMGVIVVDLEGSADGASVTATVPEGRSR
jgi:hypothetical protein